MYYNNFHNDISTITETQALIGRLSAEPLLGLWGAAPHGLGGKGLYYESGTVRDI